MVVLVVLFGSWLLLRGVGALGVATVASWHASARYALAIMFLFTAIAHFNRIKHDLARMVPAVFRRPLTIVYVTGVLELAGAVGLMLPQFARVASLCLVVLLVAMFPANVHAARKGVTLRGNPPTPLWLRIPMQLLFIRLLLWSNVLTNRLSSEFQNGKIEVARVKELSNLCM